jgi:hypothetical protein
MGIVIFLGIILFLRDRQKKYYKYNGFSHPFPKTKFQAISIPESNPANGLPMMGGDRDIRGNLYGTNNHR